MKIQTKYDIGQIVYHRVSNHRGMVTHIMVGPHGAITYTVQWSHVAAGSAYEIELSSEPAPDWGPPTATSGEGAVT